MFLNIPVINTTVVKPAPAKSEISKPTLKYHSVGEDVKLMQKKINQLGGYHLREDGIFGPKTYTTLIAFQYKNGLKSDGICGPKTWRFLLK